MSERRSHKKEILIGIVVTVAGGLILHFLLGEGPPARLTENNECYAHRSGALRLDCPDFLDAISVRDAAGYIHVTLGNGGEPVFIHYHAYHGKFDRIFRNDNFIAFDARPLDESAAKVYLRLRDWVINANDDAENSTLLSMINKGDGESGQLHFLGASRRDEVIGSSVVFIARRVENGVLVFAVGKVDGALWERHQSQIRQAIANSRFDATAVLNHHLTFNGFRESVISPDEVRKATPAGLTLRYTVDENGEEGISETVHIYSTNSVGAKAVISREYSDGRVDEPLVKEFSWSDLIPRIRKDGAFLPDYELQWNDESVSAWAYTFADDETQDTDAVIRYVFRYKSLPAFVGREVRKSAGTTTYSRRLVRAEVEPVRPPIVEDSDIEPGPVSD